MNHHPDVQKLIEESNQLQTLSSALQEQARIQDEILSTLRLKDAELKAHFKTQNWFRR